MRTKREREVVILDYGDFRNIDFVECKIVYKGGQPPTLIENNFERCAWYFEGEARNTLDFLRSLASSRGGAREFVLGDLLGLADE